MERELSSAELYRKDRSEFFRREKNMNTEERKRIGECERFEVNGVTVTINRSLGETSIYEDSGTRKIRLPGYGEVEVDDSSSCASIISTPMTPKEEKIRNEEIFQIMDRRAREDLENAYILR